MRTIEWAMWANEQAIISAGVTLMGGILGVAGFFKNWEFAAYAIVASILVFIVEYPRGQLKSGKTVERRFQKYVTRILGACGPVTRNYYVRFLFHLILSVPCCFVLPTVLGGMCLFITSIIYFVAAYRGEEWKPCIQKKQASRIKETGAHPNYPPPRRPGTAEDDSASRI